MKYSLLDNLILHLNHTYLHTHNDSTDAEILNQPANKVNIGFNYDLNLERFCTISWFWNTVYTTGRPYPAANLNYGSKTDDLYLTNTSLVFKELFGKPVDFSITAMNLFNKSYGHIDIPGSSARSYMSAELPRPGINLFASLKIKY